MRVFLVISDSLRYDHVNCLGDHGVDTPEIDQLISESVNFENCYIGSFPTLPHRFDLLTGQFGFHYRGWEKIRDTDITLAEILQDYGYITQLITDTSNLTRREYNYDRGYIGNFTLRGQERDIYLTKMNTTPKASVPWEKARHSYYFKDISIADLGRWLYSDWQPNRENHRFAPRVSHIAQEWLEDNYLEENLFLHLDFFDPHEPWDPPQYLVNKYCPKDYDGIQMYNSSYGKADAFTKDEMANMHGRYKGAVELTSKSIGGFITKLKSIGIYDDSMIIFTSDHGHYFGEHNCSGKSNIQETDERGFWPLFNELTHVPLAIKMPKGEMAGKTISGFVQPVDILPTILDILNISQSEKLPGKSNVVFEMDEHPGVPLGRKQGLNPLHGVSLLPLMNGEKGRREMVFSCSCLSPTAGLNFMRGGGSADNPPLAWSSINNMDYSLYIGGLVGDSPLLYDLKADPKEINNIYVPDHPAVQKMSQAYFDFLTNELKASGEIIERLKKYLAAEVTRKPWG